MWLQYNSYDVCTINYVSNILKKNIMITDIIINYECSFILKTINN